MSIESGHQPLSWTASTQIELDAAKGIEYIRDHTKSRAVKELQVTPKTDVFAFRVVLAELITGQHALICDSKETYKMKSLITVINNVFQDEHPEDALEAVIEGNLRGIYPFEHVYKMAEIAQCFLSEDVVDRPEMREIVVSLSNLVTYSIEWEASLGGNSQVFSGLFNGR
nr:lysm domain receptor-like kinase 3 [Quercus suber]